MKHTPGPMKETEAPAPLLHLNCGCEIISPHRSRFGVKFCALHNSAPELLEALELMKTYCVGGVSYGKISEIAEQAIAKTKGGNDG